MMKVSEYIDVIDDVVNPKWSGYVAALARLCNIGTPSEKEIGDFLSVSGSITANRRVFNIIEGCNSAFLTVIHAKVEWYNPCPDMIDNLNKTIYNGYDYSSSDAYDFGEHAAYIENSDLFRSLTHPKTKDDLFNAMVEMLKHKVYTKWHHATVVLYVEAVLIFRFDSIWDITTVDPGEFKEMIAEARTGSPEKLMTYYTNNVQSLRAEDIQARNAADNLFDS